MTDPVDTDTLRVAASMIDQGFCLIDGIMLCTAADEVDRLRAVIAGAPHGIGCASPAESLLGVARDPERPCTCWKADAL